jgi:hypothetical protein
MTRRNTTPQYGSKRKGGIRRTEAWLGSKLFYIDPEGRVMVKEVDMDPYPAEPDEIPEKLRKPTSQ